MSTKMMKVLITIATILMVVTMLGTTVFAGEGITPGTLKDKVDYSGTEDIGTIGGKLMGIIQTVGVVVAVLIIMVIGIKYMMGSAEEKAEYKKTMIPYVVGAILIFGASTVASMVYKFATEL